MTLGNAVDQKWVQRLDIASSSTSPLLYLDIILPEHLGKYAQVRPSAIPCVSISKIK